jgi:hypothetical protein
MVKSTLPSTSFSAVELRSGGKQPVRAARGPQEVLSTSLDSLKQFYNEAFSAMAHIAMPLKRRGALLASAARTRSTS